MHLGCQTFAGSGSKAKNRFKLLKSQVRSVINLKLAFVTLRTIYDIKKQILIYILFRNWGVLWSSDAAYKVKE